MEAYCNDHCYLRIELWKQLRTELENSVSVNSSKRMTYFKSHQAKNIGRNEKLVQRSYVTIDDVPLTSSVKRSSCKKIWQFSQQWRKRTADEEREILFKFEKEGLDQEDLKFLEESFYMLQNNEMALWNKKLCWVAKEVPSVRQLDKSKKNGKHVNYYDDRKLEEVIPHFSGCARTEGYYKPSREDKRGVSRQADIFLRKENSRSQLSMQLSREAHNTSRCLLTTMSVSSDIYKINHLTLRRKLVKFARSKIHGWGLYALEAIAPDEIVIEYIGQKIRPTVADVREKLYEKRGIGSSYLFCIDSDYVIDATQMGNLARFINHSCQPNCYAKVIVVGGEKRIVIYSRLSIDKGEEITYDYKFPVEKNKIDCLCGAPNCRGSLN
ncbi:unnamed protein product [Thelazia callipaeda]|uniref:[histone H3]-lysine(4) N-trimethyltransferase n=1 Tax=Thelazia callipaeda TaxID=103827 RepID=A0A0N5CUL8_THECL|nr:unnamed protein product [Thelazia callipaeda]